MESVLPAITPTLVYAATATLFESAYSPALLLYKLGQAELLVVCCSTPQSVSMVTPNFPRRDISILIGSPRGRHEWGLSI